MATVVVMALLRHTEDPLALTAEAMAAVILTRLAAMAAVATHTLVAAMVEATTLNTLLAALRKRPRFNNGTVKEVSSTRI